MIDESRLASKSLAATRATNPTVLVLSNVCRNIIGEMANDIMTTQPRLCQALKFAFLTRTSMLFYLCLNPLRMLRLDMIIQSLLGRRFISTILALVLESTVVVGLVMHVHGCLILLYNVTVGAAILTTCVFLVRIDHLYYVDMLTRPTGVSIFYKSSIKLKNPIHTQ